LDSWTKKHRYSDWNFFALWFTSCDISIESLEAAILEFQLLVEFNSPFHNVIDMGNFGSNYGDGNHQSITQFINQRQLKN